MAEAEARSEARRGPDVLARPRAGVPARGARVARGERPARAAPVRRHGGGVRAPPRVGEEALRRALGGRLVAEGVRRARGEPRRVAHLRGGVLPRRRAAADRAERHLPPRADARSSFGTAGAEGAHPAADGRGARTSGRRAGRSRTRGAISRASRAARCATRRAAAGGSPARRRGARAARSATGCSASSAAIRAASGTAASRTSSSRCAPRASPCARSARLDGDAGFADVFLDDVFVPDRDVLGEVNEGWSVAMATDELRARAHAAEPGALRRHRRAPRRALPRARRRRRRSRAARRRRPRVDRRRGLPPLHAPDGRRRLDGGGAIGAESSVNKVFWSEMDVRMHETALRLLGAASAGARRDDAVDEGLPVRARRPDLRRHERDPAQRRRRARARPAEVTAVRFAFTPEQLASATACATLLARECPPARVRAAWAKRDAAGSRAVGDSSRSWASSGCSRPEEHGGLGLDELDWCSVLEERGRFAAPEPLVETAAVAVPLLRDAGSDARSAGCAAIGDGEAPVAIGPRRPRRSCASADTADLVSSMQRGRGPRALTRDAVHLEPHAVRSTARAASSRSAGRHRAPRASSTEPGATALLHAARDRGALATAAQLIGLARAHARDDGRLREGAPPVRQADRQLPGREAPPRRRAHRRSSSPRPAVYRAAYSLAHADAERSIHVSMAKACASDAADARRPRRRCSATARSATRSRTIFTSG